MMVSPQPRPDEAPAPAAPRPQVERSERLTTILMTGRLIADGRDHLCRIRNLSPGGMLVESTADLAPGERVTIELRNLNIVAATVVWVQPQRAGLQFDAPVDVSALLHVPDHLSDRSPRSPRLSAACPVLVWHLGRTVAATLRDISQSGCRLAIDHPPPAGATVRITIPGLPPRHASRRWAKADAAGMDEAGFAFQDLLSFTELATWEQDYGVRFSR